ncbi:hypothetical protein T439DRAFT_359617 [Meredithblackwellia eburnea MCA 4105]
MRFAAILAVLPIFIGFAFATVDPWFIGTPTGVVDTCGKGSNFHWRAPIDATATLTIHWTAAGSKIDNTKTIDVSEHSNGPVKLDQKTGMKSRDVLFTSKYVGLNLQAGTEVYFTFGPTPKYSSKFTIAKCT